MKNSGIQWTDHTFNPWIGCTKWSDGCKLCYAEHSTFARVKRSQGHETWGKGAQRVRTMPDYWKQPLKWDRAAALHGFRPRVFCASLADWLDAEVPIEWLGDLLSLIFATPHLDWLLLTKRPENFYRLEEAKVWSDYQSSVAAWIDGTPPSNVWFGVTAENQKEADKRIPILLTIPARIRFLSCEPLLGPISLERWLALWEYCGNCGTSFNHVPNRKDLCPECGVPNCMCTGFGSELRDEYDNTGGHIEVPDGCGIDWVIIGGESGEKTDPVRPCDIGWIRWLVSQCQRAGVPAFVKQLGSKPEAWEQIDRLSPNSGPHINLRHKKGGDITEWPEDLRIREFPSTLSPQPSTFE